MVFALCYKPLRAAHLECGDGAVRQHYDAEPADERVGRPLQTGGGPGQPAVRVRRAQVNEADNLTGTQTASPSS